MDTKNKINEKYLTRLNFHLKMIKNFLHKIIKSGINADLVFNEYDKEVSGFQR